MFGYVTVCRDAMKSEDYQLFTAYYCGLCKATGKCASQFARMGLSYDITFLAIILSALMPEENLLKSGRCIAHPLKKREYVCNSDVLDYAACMGTILTYLKFQDDVSDDKSVKAMALSAMFYSGVRKARKGYKRQYDEIIYLLRKLSSLEKENCSEIDECADCFAKILETLFTPDFIEDNETRRILKWFGYNIGRWIYVIDAYNDIDKDYKKKNYNPFLAKDYGELDEYKKQLKEKLEMSLTFTLENAASAFELLRTYKNKSVAEHIIYCGLKARQTAVLGEKNESV